MVHFVLQTSKTLVLSRIIALHAFASHFHADILILGINKGMMGICRLLVKSRELPGTQTSEIDKSRSIMMTMARYYVAQIKPTYSNTPACLLAPASVKAGGFVQ